MVAARLMLRAWVLKFITGKKLLVCRRVALLALLCIALSRVLLLPNRAVAENNSAPYLTLSSSYLGSGVWRISGHVVDENPGDITVTLWGSPLGEEEVVLETDANGDFTYPVVILGAGAVYGDALDDHGYYSATATTYVGY